LLVAVASAIFARHQAQGQRGANTPTVVATTSNNRPGVGGNLELTFSSKDRIRSAVVKIRPGSEMVEIGLPQGGRLGSRATIRDIANDTPIVLPAKFVDGKTQAKITVTMKGASFGKRTVSLDPKAHNLFIY